MKSKKRFLNILLVSISFILFISYLHPTFNVDEEYTMGLIQHSYSALINVNSMDVHPATYYLLLKFLLSITTFWTRSFFVKVMFARIFSIIPFVVMFITLFHVINISGIHINWKIQLIIYILLPPISLYATDIRMHEFSAMFNVLEYYELIKFSNSNNKVTHTLIIALIYAVVSSYIDYFSAVCSGLFLFVFFLECLLRRKIIKSIKIFISGISMFILCIPLILLMFKQISIRRHYLSTSNNVLFNINNLLDSFTQLYGSTVITIIIILIMIIPILWQIFYTHNKKITYRLFEIFFNYLSALIISVIACLHFNVYEPKFMYPQFSIYSFFIVAIFICMINNYMNLSWVVKLFVRIFIVVILLLVPLKEIGTNVMRYTIPTIRIANNLNKRIHSTNKKVYINYHKSPNYISSSNAGKQVYITQESVYLNNYNKILIVKHSSYKHLSKIVNGKSLLFKDIFSNIRIKN